MGDGARPTDLRREDDIGAQERHRHAGKIEVEMDSPTDEERACQELAIFPETVCEVDRRQTQDDDSSQQHVEQHDPCS